MDLDIVVLQAATSAAQPQRDDGSPGDVASCSSEYDATWLHTANLTQMMEVAAQATSPAAAASAPSPPPTASPHINSDDIVAAAVDTVATQDVVLATPIFSTAVPQQLQRPAEDGVGAAAAAAGDNLPPWGVSPPDKVRAKRLFEPESDEDAWMHPAAALALSGETVIVPGTSPKLQGNEINAVSDAARRGNKV